jgi:hypothetical protein
VDHDTTPVGSLPAMGLNNPWVLLAIAVALGIIAPWVF